MWGHTHILVTCLMMVWITSRHIISIPMLKSFEYKVQHITVIVNSGICFKIGATKGAGGMSMCRHVFCLTIDMHERCTTGAI